MAFEQRAGSAELDEDVGVGHRPRLAGPARRLKRAYVAITAWKTRRRYDMAEAQ